MRATKLGKRTNKKLQIIPLGGVGEIGKNMTAYVYGESILVVDCGLMFPHEWMLGVDIVIPDITYLEEHADQVVGIILTHGHEDHIGALPYVLRRLDVPVYGTPLTLGFVSNKLEEHRMLDVARLNTVTAGDVLELGEFKVEFLRMSHSIPDVMGLAIKTSVGTVFMTSDFKFDQSPIDGKVASIGRYAELGDEGVLALLCDTTNVERSGFTQSEALVGESFARIFNTAPGRIIIAAFASNIHRVQQIHDIAAQYGKRVAVIGRSMSENCRIAEELGYLKIPEGTRLLVGDLGDVPPSKTVIVTTGSQGEPLSALSKMAQEDHKYVNIREGDTVVISATPIPGNENLILRTVNRLFGQGAEVIYEPYTKVHVSGHGNQEDIRLLLNLVRPKYLIPVHGEQRHFHRFCSLAQAMGYARESIFILGIGDVLEFGGEQPEIAGTVASGSVMVDGLGVGDVVDVVLRDRRHLAEAGVVVMVAGVDMKDRALVSGPDFFSKGFAEQETGQSLLDEAKAVVTRRLEELVEGEDAGVEEVTAACKKVLAKFIYERTHRRPVIVPIVMET
jgi:ribonuclease J